MADASLNAGPDAGDLVSSAGASAIPDDVAEAVRTTGASMIDVSSGVESAPGAKDVAKIAAFLQAVAQC